MKHLFALALLCLAISGCAEESKVETKVETPGGSTTETTTVEKTGDHKAP